MNLFLANIGGWIVAHRRLVLIIIGGLAVLVLVFMAYRGCTNRKPTLNEVEIRKAQDAIARKDREAMIEVLAVSDAKQAAIDANVAEGRQQVLEAVNASRRENANKTNEELAAELERRAKE